MEPVNFYQRILRLLVLVVLIVSGDTLLGQTVLVGIYNILSLTRELIQYLMYILTVNFESNNWKCFLNFLQLTKV